MRGGAGVAILLLVLALPASAGDSLAVFDVEALAEGGAVVDFGSRVPASGIPAIVTLAGASGARVVHLVRRMRRCESLCGEMDTPTCHEAALYRSADGGLPRLPTIAIAGRHDLDAREARFETSADPPEQILRSWISADFRPAPPLRGPTRWQYRWQPTTAGEGVKLERRFGDGRNTFDAAIDDPYPGERCRVERHESLTSLLCAHEAWLYEDDTLVLHAGTDGYGPATLELVARFSWHGLEHRVVVFAGKGYRSTALLRREGRRWRVLVPPKDYPFLC